MMIRLVNGIINIKTNGAQLQLNFTLVESCKQKSHSCAGMASVFFGSSGSIKL